MEGFLSEELKEWEITWYVELWGNGKQMTIRVAGGGHEGAEDTGQKQATPEPHDSV
jgi:hypothetical protein